ncbi:Iota-carrageenase A2 [Flammeovirga sp. MY04]|uniref:glycosyl hydrolase family 28-related protein n=1 Tax=Flammeovirga sp. MY04 TaxID=1191459 RepID=UPI0008063BAD|nr:glycosyl hydrolase family 28-related protein [Flammeovirga sp. MY04]ANQ51608.1 Iota-carrageenase A2 [Flammeovirga sp. MY04]
MNLKQLLFITSIFVVSNIWAQDEADFYTDKINDVTKTVNLVDDYGVNNQDDEDDSEALQRAIDELTELPNGGRINIPAGKYYFQSILVKSNIHITIDTEALIYPTDPGNDKNYVIMSIGKDNEETRNVSVRGVDGYYTVDVSKARNPNVRMFQLVNVKNFLISDMHLVDDNTKFSAITIGYSTYNGEYVSSENGVIKDCSTVGAHYGYGLIQSQALKNTFFKNLWGEGGVTLRLETGLNKMNDLQVGGNFDIYGQNIYCENGNAAVMISPHAIKNGHVEIDGVEAVNTGFAVRIGKGYVTSSQEALGITPGYYASTSIVKNVKATYGCSAQVKSKHFKYFPCEEKQWIGTEYNPDGESYPAPAVANILNTADGNNNTALGYFDVAISNTESIGFKHQPKDVVTEEDENTECGEIPPVTDGCDCECNNSGGVSNLPPHDDPTYFVFPNPSPDKFKIRGDIRDTDQIHVINQYGAVINVEPIFYDTRWVLNLQNQPIGIYFLNINGTIIKLLKE